jgi:hypothetical protein
MVQSGWINFNSVAALKLNRRKYGVEISPDSVIAGETRFYDVKISNLTDRMRFSVTQPNIIGVEYCGHTFVPDSVTFTNDSTMQCRFTFPFVADRQALNFRMVYPFAEINLGSYEHFSVLPARKIKTVSADTIVGYKAGSILLTMSDDDFEVSDIKSIMFSTEQMKFDNSNAGGATPRYFMASSFQKVAPYKLQVEFYANYEESARVYYLSILKNDSTIWLPPADVKIVVLNAPVGVDEFAVDGMISIAPNPANSDANIVFAQGLVGKADITIISPNGEEISRIVTLDNQSSESRLPLSDFIDCISGAYLISIRLGDRAHTYKFVVVE